MFLKIRSRNGSAAALRRQIVTTTRGVYRCGSLTPNNEIFTRQELRNGIIEINTVEASRLSNNKTEMKKRFDQFGVATAAWDTIENVIRKVGADQTDEIFALPWIIKHNHSSRGEGIYFINTIEEFQTFIQESNHRRNHIVEHYYTYTREYRLHVDKFGCFCANRKMLRNDATERWHRHHSNSVWIREDNELFQRPANWDLIVNEAQKARRALGLDICSVDIKVQGRPDNPLFFILETNSGSALGEQTTPLYIQEVQRIVREKCNGINETFPQLDDNVERAAEVTTATNVETHPDVVLTDEEKQNVKTVETQGEKTIPKFSAESVTSESTKQQPTDCNKDFEACSHVIWTGSKYGWCDLNDKPCPFFYIDTDWITSEHDDDDEDYDDDDDEEYDESSF